MGASAALIADPLVGQVAVAGRLGLTEQAALAVGVAALTLAAWLLNALLFALTSEVAGAWGAGDRAAAARARTQARRTKRRRGPRAPLGSRRRLRSARPAGRVGR